MPTLFTTIDHGHGTGKSDGPQPQWVRPLALFSVYAIIAPAGIRPARVG